MPGLEFTSPRQIAIRALAVLAMCIVPIFASGCFSKPDPLNVIVLLDATCDEAYWAQSIEAAQYVAREMGPSDRLQINAIDDLSGEDSDVLIAPVVLDPRAVFAKGQAAELVKTIGSVHQPELQGRGTDIVGALRDASNILIRTIQTPSGHRVPRYTPLVIICSDMRPDFRDPDAAYAAAPFTFPQGTRIRCLFVTKDTEATTQAVERARQQGVGLSPEESPDVQWRELVGWWTDFLRRAGSLVTEDDFKKVEESRMEERGNVEALRSFIRDARFPQSGR